MFSRSGFRFGGQYPETQMQAVQDTLNPKPLTTKHRNTELLNPKPSSPGPRSIQLESEQDIGSLTQPHGDAIVLTGLGLRVQLLSQCAGSFVRIEYMKARCSSLLSRRSSIWKQS